MYMCRCRSETVQTPAGAGWPREQTTQDTPPHTYTAPPHPPALHSSPLGTFISYARSLLMIHHGIMTCAACVFGCHWVRRDSREQYHLAEMVSFCLTSSFLLSLSLCNMSLFIACFSCRGPSFIYCVSGGAAREIFSV